MSNKTIFDLQQEGVPQDLVVVLRSKWNPQYEAARAISNSRFDFKPSGIAYCKNKEHVQYCLNFCRNNRINFRVRSGGHQHEGMSSGDNVLIIDLSEIHEIEYVDDDKTMAWIPVGKQLQNVYSELESHERIIPGGGCQSVNVGGLTHGGGWGLSTRYLGLTCDNVLAVEIVLADGTIAEANGENEYSDLFWAIRGGGGGNFGVVTRFKFRLTELEGVITNFAFIFDGNEEAVAKAWVRMHLDDDVSTALSTGCSILLQAPKEHDSVTPSLRVRIGGQFYGTKDELLDNVNRYFEEYPIVEKDSWIRERSFLSERSVSVIDTSSKLSLTSLQSLVAEFLNPSTPLELQVPMLSSGISLKDARSTDESSPIDPTVKTPPPAMTCDAPHPHKVTSCFPKDYFKPDGKYDVEKYETLVENIIKYMTSEHSKFTTDANQYISLHCLGGALKLWDKTERGAFPFYEKPFMLQMQSWWDFSGDTAVDEERSRIYVQWIEDFRVYLLEDVEGAFINFVDYHLVEHPNTMEGKLELLKIYYQDNLNRLSAIKGKYDSANLFNFRMSIPPFHSTNT